MLSYLKCNKNMEINNSMNTEIYMIYGDKRDEARG